MTNSVTMGGFDFTVEPSLSGGTLKYVHGWINGQCYCRIIWLGTNDLNGISYPTFEAAVEAAKKQIIQEAKEKDEAAMQMFLSAKIEASAQAASHALDLRLAALRGKVFGQMCQLRERRVA